MRGNDWLSDEDRLHSAPALVIERQRGHDKTRAVMLAVEWGRDRVLFDRLHGITRTKRRTRR